MLSPYPLSFHLLSSPFTSPVFSPLPLLLSLCHPLSTSVTQLSHYPMFSLLSLLSLLSLPGFEAVGRGRGNEIPPSKPQWAAANHGHPSLVRSYHSPPPRHPDHPDHRHHRHRRVWANPCVGLRVRIGSRCTANRTGQGMESTAPTAPTAPHVSTRVRGRAP